MAIGARSRSGQRYLKVLARLGTPRNVVGYEIGGQLDTTDGQRTIQRPFSGKILGLKFNNMQIIEQSRIGMERNTSNVSSLQAKVPETENTYVF